MIWRLCLACALVATGCHGEAPRARPSILLVVFDTVRVDAVSAYGAVDGTTPEVDRLASEGLRYERAYAQAAWTLHLCGSAVLKM